VSMKTRQNLRTRTFLILCFIGVLLPSVFAASNGQDPAETTRKEILAALEAWNDAAKNRDLARFMALYDQAPDIMLIGSDKGEIFKGKDAIEGWLKGLFGFAGFSWQMDRLDIDSHGDTAWVFADGFMIVNNDRGQEGKKPYRFTGILVKKHGTWKWRLFNGSIPAGE